MAIRSKRLEYAITMDAGARVAIPGGSGLDADADWTPEHLLLAALVRCTVASLGFHAARAGLTVTSEVAARAAVTRRASDGRHAVTSTDVTCHVTIDPVPDPNDLARLFDKAERGCFVGASLTTPPHYVWIANGVVHEPRPVRPAAGAPSTEVNPPAPGADGPIADATPPGRPTRDP